MPEAARQANAQLIARLSPEVVLAMVERLEAGREVDRASEAHKYDNVLALLNATTQNQTRL